MEARAADQSADDEVMARLLVLNAQRHADEDRRGVSAHDQNGKGDDDEAEGDME